MANGYQICGHNWGRWQDEGVIAEFHLTLSCPAVDKNGALGFVVKLKGKKNDGVAETIYENSYMSLAEAAQAYNTIKKSSLTS